MKKMKLVLSLVMIAGCVNQGVYAMQQNRSVSVDFSNQTNNALTIVTRDLEVLELPSYEDVSLMLPADFSIMAGEEKVTTVFTSQGDFFIDYNGMMNSLNLYRGTPRGNNENVGRLKNPKNPVIIFQQDAAPQIVEK